MKKLLTTLIVSVFCFVCYSASSPQTAAQVSKGSDASCAIKFHSLSRYKGERWSRVFSDREVAPTLRALFEARLRIIKKREPEGSFLP